MPTKPVMLAADAGDEAGKVLPLSVINHLKVDHALRAGDVSDTQLANVERHFRVDHIYLMRQRNFVTIVDCLYADELDISSRGLILDSPSVVGLNK